MTTCDFEWIAYAVAVCVSKAVAVAIIAGFGIRARSVIICGVSIVVARCIVLTTAEFKLVAYSVGVGWIAADSTAVVACASVGA